jgi:hypothetical protein
MAVDIVYRSTLPRQIRNMPEELIVDIHRLMKLAMNMNKGMKRRAATRTALKTIVQIDNDVMPVRTPNEPRFFMMPGKGALNMPMPTMDQLQERLSCLYEMRSKGLLRYKFKLGDAIEKEYFYRSMDDLSAEIRRLEIQTGIRNQPVPSVVVRSSKGY